MKRKRPGSRKTVESQRHFEIRADSEPQEPEKKRPQLALVSPAAPAPPTVVSPSTASDPTAAGRPLTIPTILLEGDEPTPAAVTGTGPKYALGPAAPASVLGPEPGDLPEAYGSGRLMLTARDPHCLYAHWDLTSEQQRHYNALSVDRHLVLRVYFEQAAGPPTAEQHVHPDSRHWFIHVDEAGRPYAAELGYYQADRHWRTIATSETVSTPPETLAEEKTLSFATIPWEPPQPVPRQPAQTAAPPVPGSPVTPAPIPPPPFVTRRSLFETVTPPALTAAPGFLQHDRKELQPEKCTIPIVRSEFVKSLTGQHERGAPLQIPAQLQTVPPTPAPLSISSPMENAPAGEKGFGLSLNAELVIYGATAADAQVRLGGQQIHLRPDGSFSCRFALPDGKYELGVSAVSPQGELRQAELSFSRGTRYQSQIGVHPQDPALQPPPGHVG